MSFVRNFLGVLSPLSFILTVWRKGEYVGTDQLGNKYYRADPRKGYRHEQRWVLYKAEAEASLVPPEWHGWLHHQTDTVPSDSGLSYRKPWQLPAQSNRTGTVAAYHPVKDGSRQASGSDYEAWKPGN
jgi:NADH:ubiquinone oxidoreductase subunit